MKSEELNIFTKTALIAVLVNNDFHYMHLLSIGRDFDKSHNLAQDYYDMIDGEVDYLMELALEVKAPIYNYNNGKAIESKNPIGFGFGLFASYKLNMTSNLSLAANAGIEVTAGKNKPMTGVKQTYIDVRAIADLSCSYSFGKMSAFRLGVKGQAPFWGSMTIKTGNQTATSNTSIDFGSYFIVTPYVGYCISY